MVWKQLEPTASHITYLILSSFLILYALFSLFVRNRLHLSEPPLATLVGIIFGPKGFHALDPAKWGLRDNTTQELTRVIVGIQCFAVGIELPKFYFSRHWKSVAMLLGPVMAGGWVVCALLVWLLFDTSPATALVIGACLTPTDPVLAASVLSNSQFSTRVPNRLKHLLSAESGCNDGVSFPFLYFGIYILIEKAAGNIAREWFLITILWQCCFGTFMGLFIGVSANWLLRFSDGRDMIGRASYLVFYFLLALFSIGVASTLGSDDFLVAFGAGVGFARDGWFRKKTEETHLPNVIDLLLNSSLFVYFGAIIPWHAFSNGPNLSIGRLIALLALILLFRRLPFVLALKRWIPNIHTYREALFCGHFGPMGVGALFLAIEARAELETGSSLPLPHPPKGHSEHKGTIEIIWPMICFIVLGSTMVHGLSTAIISVGSHFSRHKHERAHFPGAETDALDGMEHAIGAGDSEPSSEEEDD
ncbi:MAG: hypothetical protein M1835_005078 [Candelina submexicana]|nr:MAG: hypothetical protein M1835_005078 [Candelina submexicana]